MRHSEIVTSFKFLLSIAISIQEADIAYGYILYNYKDISANDSSLVKALKAVWKTLCGKEKGLTKKTCMIIAFPFTLVNHTWSEMQLDNIHITFARYMIDSIHLS